MERGYYSKKTEYTIDCDAETFIKISNQMDIQEHGDEIQISEAKYNTNKGTCCITELSEFIKTK